jgi:hypothetical protein
VMRTSMRRRGVLNVRYFVWAFIWMTAVTEWGSNPAPAS